MGIKSLNDYLRKEKIPCFLILPMTALSGQRVGVDYLNWIFTYLPQAFKRAYNSNSNYLDVVCQEKLFKELVVELTRFNNKLLNYKITPVWICDGISKDNKTATKVERRKKRKDNIIKRDNVRELLLSQSPLERDPAVIEEYKKSVLKCQYIEGKSIEKLKDICKYMGLPTIIAEDEAENLASSLAVERKISAVWSADTDTYPLGAPLVIKGFDNINGQLHIKCTFTLKILQGLDMNHEEFRDFCILLGTDFNNNLEGIGPSKSRILIEKYRTLERIQEETKHNLEGFIDYKNIRKQLTPYKTEYTCVDLQVDKNIDLEKLKMVCDIIEMDMLYQNIIDLPPSRGCLRY